MDGPFHETHTASTKEILNYLIQFNYILYYLLTIIIFTYCEKN